MASSSTDYSKLKVSELKKLIHDRSLSLFGCLDKVDLIDCLKKNDAKNNNTSPTHGGPAVDAKPADAPPTSNRTSKVGWKIVAVDGNITTCPFESVAVGDSKEEKTEENVPEENKVTFAKVESEMHKVKVPEIKVTLAEVEETHQVNVTEENKVTLPEAKEQAAGVNVPANMGTIPEEAEEEVLSDDEELGKGGVSLDGPWE